MTYKSSFTLFAFVLFIAYTDDSSENVSAADNTSYIESSAASLTDSSTVISSTDSSQISQEESNDSEAPAISVSYGIDPLEGTVTGIISVDSIDNMPTTSSSKTDYRFTTTKTSYYEGSYFINLYYEESGLEVLATHSNGNYVSTYHLKSSEDADKQYIVRLWNSFYIDTSACTRDLTYFQKHCEYRKGEYFTYENSCSINSKLEIACVYPNTISTDRDSTLQKLAEDEKSFVEKYWCEESSGRFESGT